jgi:hypothetical protein
MASTRRIERGQPKAGPFRATPRRIREAPDHQGIPPRDPFSAPRVLQRGAELRRVEQLPWPTNWFWDIATIAERMAAAAQCGLEARILDDLCPCGCRRVHKHRESQPCPTRTTPLDIFSVPSMGGLDNPAFGGVDVLRRATAKNRHDPIRRRTGSPAWRPSAKVTRECRCRAAKVGQARNKLVSKAVFTRELKWQGKLGHGSWHTVLV